MLKQKMLQVAIDCNTKQRAFEIMRDVAEYVDIIEIGTPLVLAVGASFAAEVKALYPDKIVFLDEKIMDGGKIIADHAFDCGADLVSVLGVSEDSTLRSAIASAHEHGKYIVVDLCAVDDLFARAKDAEAFGADLVGVHVGYDIQATGADPLQELKKLSGIKLLKTVAGGIKKKNFEDACRSDANVVIVGGGLCNVPDPRETAKWMCETMNKYR